MLNYFLGKQTGTPSPDMDELLRRQEALQRAAFYARCGNALTP